MKKKGTLILICALLAVIFALTGCGDSKKSGNEKAGNKTGKETYLTFTAGGVGGSWYIMAASLNEAFESNIPGLKMTIVPGAGMANPTVIHRGAQAQIGLTYSGNAIGAMNGGEGYKERHTDMMAIANLNMKQYLTLMLAADMGIKNFNDIKAKKPALKVSVGPRGSGSEQMFRRAVNEHGMTYDDIKKWGGEIQFTSPTDGANAFRDGQANGISGSSPLGNPYMMDVASIRDIVIIPIDKNLENNFKKYGYTGGVIPAKTYRGQNEDAFSVYDSVMFIVNKKVDEDIVYRMTKILCENKAKWLSTHNMWADFEAKDAPKVNIPLHPGAAKYYKEKGYM